MKTTTTNLIAIVTIIAVGLAASTASADNKNNKKSGGFSISFGGGSNKNWHNFHNFHHDHHYVKKVYVTPSYYDTCYYPLHRLCFVLPGDTWYTIAQREYGNTNLCHYIASYNRLPFSTQLFVGQQIVLPEVHPGGVLRASSAPMPAPFVPAIQPIVTQNFVSPAVNATPTVPSANIRPATEEVSIPSLAIGSVIVLDGQTLGNDKGIVRLRLAEMALPVEVLEWTNTSAKVRLPQMELAGAMRAELEVLRADGSLASKSPVQLTLATSNAAANLAATSGAQGN
jgi:hypothetical protein